MRGLSTQLHRAAGAFEQKRGCGCAKRQARMNAAIPGSGDAVKAAASTVARGLHGAAKWIGGEPPVLGAPTILGQHLPARRRASAWTVPPEMPEGWSLVDHCGKSALYAGPGSFVVWDIADGHYRRFHGFSDQSLATREFERRCG